MWNRLRLPSPSMAVALLALFVALSGTAAAVTVDFAKNAHKVDGKHAVGASATPAQAAGKLVATAGGGANKGQFAPKFIPVNHHAWAHVTGGATPSLAGARKFTAVSHPATGEYCLTPAAGIDPTKQPLILSIDWSSSLGNDLLAFWRSSGMGCGAGEYDVLTFDFAAGGAPVASDDVAFVAMVP